MMFDGSDENPEHPEDWKLTPGTDFKIIGNYDHSILDGLTDEAGDLWGRDSADTRKIPAGTAKDTLRLVKPDAPVLVEALHEYNSFENKDQFKKILSIASGGVVHKFTITDPVFETKYGISPQKVSKDKPMKITLAPGGLVIVVSLTPPWNGYHYKVAAAIIEP